MKNEDEPEPISKKTMGNGQPRKTKWEHCERYLLFATFICVAISTYYAVLTSQKALEQASLAIRPWIIIEKTNTTLNDEVIETKFHITNIGKTPAYITIERKAHHNDKLTPNSGFLPIESNLVLMPTQTVFVSGITINKDAHRKMKEGGFVDDITQSIRVNYGMSEDTVDTYYTYQKVRFDHKEFSGIIKDSKQQGIWDIIESDFK